MCCHDNKLENDLVHVHINYMSSNHFRWTEYTSKYRLCVRATSNSEVPAGLQHTFITHTHEDWKRAEATGQWNGKQATVQFAQVIWAIL